MQRFALAAALAIAAASLQGCGSHGQAESRTTNSTVTVLYDYVQVLLARARAQTPGGEHYTVDACSALSLHVNITPGTNVTGSFNYPVAGFDPAFYVFNVDAKGPYLSWPSVIRGRVDNVSESFCRFGDWQDERIANYSPPCGLPPGSTLCFVGANESRAGTEGWDQWRRFYFLVAVVAVVEVPVGPVPVGPTTTDAPQAVVPTEPGLVV